MLFDDRFCKPLKVYWIKQNQKRNETNSDKRDWNQTFKVKIVPIEIWNFVKVATKLKSKKMVEPQITVTQSEPTIKSSLIVVSNRLPFVLKKDPKTGELSRSAR